MIFHTYGVKYIGSKKTIAPVIGNFSKALGVTTAIDVFTGTTRVAQYLRQVGIKTLTSDLSWASECYANTFVHNQNNAHLQVHIDRMNALTPVQGWLTSNYTGDTDPSAPKGKGRCWQPNNASKADSARDYVHSLTTLEPWEKDTLITSIILALDKVDNTVGVQQAYLKEWCSRSFNQIQFVLPSCIEGPTWSHLTGNALTLDYPPAELAYLDPPYSPHSYATYYHIWDSIAKWDKPPTGLTARRRVDRVSKNLAYTKDMESDWNVRGKAKDAFLTLMLRLPVRYIMISYNDESIVKQEELIGLCSEVDKHHNPVIHEIDYRRNIMSQIGNAVRNVTEKTPDSLPVEGPKKAQRNKELLVFIEKK